MLVTGYVQEGERGLSSLAEKCDRGVWPRLMAYRQADPDLSAVWLDSTAGAPARGGCAQGQRGGFRPRPPLIQELLLGVAVLSRAEASAQAPIVGAVRRAKGLNGCVISALGLLSPPMPAECNRLNRIVRELRSSNPMEGPR